MATVCSYCGQSNRDDALICSKCSARLGVEPTGSALGALGGGRSAPSMPTGAVRLEAEEISLRHRRRESLYPRDRDARPGWVLAAVSFLVALAACGAYLWSGDRVPAMQDAAASATPAPASTPAATSAPASTPVALTPAPDRGPTAAPEEAAAGSAPRAAPSRARSDAPHSRPERRVVVSAPAPTPATERPRRPRSNSTPVRTGDPTAGAEPANAPAWTVPEREAANTASPNYSDAGPPIVAGPGPRYTAPTTPASAQQREPALPPMPAVVGGDPAARSGLGSGVR